MSEIVILHLDTSNEEIYTKLLEVINGSGYQLQTISPDKNMILHIKDLEIIPENYQVFRDGKEIFLTGKEFEILILLARNRGRVFSKEQIYDAVWNNEYVFDERNMTAYINKIRRKIEPDPAHPRYIITVWGVGYKFSEGTK
ncbi:MAG: winged helix-turn-helix domain-containing protein [Clostridium sp.]|nr:winged helix-turn-helix domain-containing protein [Clostridium sp.]